jgi:hypothetical protein
MWAMIVVVANILVQHHAHHLVGHFLVELQKLTAQPNQAKDETSAERQRADRSESDNLALLEALASERSRSESLGDQVAAR